MRYPRDSLQCPHNKHDGVSNNQHIECFAQPFVQAQINEIIKALYRWTLWVESTDDQWFILTKGLYASILLRFVLLLCCNLFQEDICDLGEEGGHRSPVNSPHKGQWRGALMFSLICAWINGQVNNHEAGDLRRLRAHYDVIVTNFLITHPLREEFTPHQ